MVKKIYHHIKGDAFLRNNVIFFAASLFVAFLNYLYYPVMGRVLSVEEFGEIQTIFSLVFISGVVLTVFRMIVLHIATNEEVVQGYQASDSSRSIPALYTLSLLIHAPFLIALVVFSPIISRYFSFESHWSFAFFSIYLLLSIYHTFYTAYLHGKNSFTSLSVSNILAAGGKLVLSFGLVMLGFGVSGAVGALVIISFLTLIYMKRRSHGLKLVLTSTRHMRDVLRKEIPYGFLIFISLGFVTLLYSVDVIIVKRMFSPEIAGLYSGIATVARIIFFATASVSGVLLSSITMQDIEKKNMQVLKKAIILVTGIGGALLLFFALFPAFVVNLLIGAKYVPYAHLLGEMSLYLFLVSLLNLVVSYLLALRARVLYPVTLCGVLILVATLYMHHETPEKVVFSFTLGAGLSLFLAIVAIFVKKT